MITPSIKTNLILKEMGITRYELRSHQEKLPPKKIYSYQKGNILTLLKQSYDDLSNDELINPKKYWYYNIIFVVKRIIINYSFSIFP